MQRPDPSSIPDAPGVYLYKDAQGTIIYVGKARVLKKRVLSYFRRDISPKTAAMLSHAASVEFLTTTTEKEALLLEAGLIKRHHPHYNISLRDDKQYFLFRMDERPDYPRLEIVRTAGRDAARYFGPFTSALAARDTWKLLLRTFGLRRCTDRAMKNRVRPCLYHHLGQCLAPCQGTLDRELYHEAVRGVCALLDGKSDGLIRELSSRMEAASNALAFEEAAALRDQIRAIRKTVEQQAVILPGNTDLDVIGLVETERGMDLTVLFVRNGGVIDKKSYYWPRLRRTDSSELIGSFLTQFYAYRLPPPRILFPESLWKKLQQSSDETDPEEMAAGLSALRSSRVLLVPAENERERGLIEIATSNAREDARRIEQNGGEDILARLKKVLRLPALPHRIECVDVSHTQGAETRVGLVVYQDGQPSKADYRIYSMPASRDDYASLAAWIPRRLASGPPFPDLLLIDGGRGQLASVSRALSEAGCAGLFPLAGIAKARREDGREDRRAGNVADRIFLPNRTNPLPLREGSAELLFLQQIRNSSHHFAITSHRAAHKKTALSGKLNNLPGIGPSTARLLWDHFTSLSAMCEATIEELKALPGIGAKRAVSLHRALKELKS